MQKRGEKVLGYLSFGKLNPAHSIEVNIQVLWVYNSSSKHTFLYVYPTETESTSSLFAQIHELELN